MPNRQVLAMLFSVPDLEALGGNMHCTPPLSLAVVGPQPLVDD